MPKFGSEFSGRLDPDGRFCVWPTRKTASYAHSCHNQRVYSYVYKKMLLLRCANPAFGRNQPEQWVIAALYEMPDSKAGISREAERSELGSSKLTNSEKPRRARGSRGITSYGRRLVRNAVGVMERRFSRHRLTFFTGTFPVLSKDDEGCLVEGFSRGLNLFIKKLQYHLQKKGLSTQVVGCIEVQEKRRERTGELGWHLHLVFNAKKNRKDIWAFTPKEMQEIWQTTWETILKRQYEWNASTRVEKIVRSAASYLGKYLSKGLKDAKLLSTTTSQTETPSSWYVCSMFLREVVKKLTRTGNSIGMLLANMIRYGSDKLLFVSSLKKTGSDGYDFFVCHFGTCKYTNYDSHAFEFP